MNLSIILTIFSLFAFQAYATQTTEFSNGTPDEFNKKNLRQRIFPLRNQGYVKLKEKEIEDKPWYQEIEEDFLKWIVNREKSTNLAYMVGMLQGLLEDDKAFNTYAESHYGITNKEHLEYLRFLCESRESKSKETVGWLFDHKK